MYVDVTREMVVVLCQTVSCLAIRRLCWRKGQTCSSKYSKIALAAYMVASKALSKVLYEIYHVHIKFSMQDMMRLTQSYYARTLSYTLPGIVFTHIHSYPFKSRIQIWSQVRWPVIWSRQRRYRANKYEWNPYGHKIFLLGIWVFSHSIKHMKHRTSAYRQWATPLPLWIS